MIDIGTVIKLHVTDTTPPKTKYFIIVGFSNDKVSLAAIYINSNINENVNYCDTLKQLQIIVPQNDHSFLKWDSYADCSKINEKNRSDIERACNEKSDICVGCIVPEKLTEIITTIRHATTIKGKVKNKFGFYD